jgi:hypothetical protein
MKSVALIIWLLGAQSHEQIVVRSHHDDMAACEARAAEVAEKYAREAKKTRHLCHVVVLENEDVDENGNPIVVK